VTTAWCSMGPIFAAIAALVLGVIVSQRCRPIRRPAVQVPADTTAPRRRRMFGGALTTAAIAIGALVIGVVGTGFALATLLLVRKLGPFRVARRRRAEIERALPDAMDLLVLSVRAGLTPFQAVCDLGASDVRAIADAFGEVVRRTERGLAFADALGALPEMLGNQASGLADVVATSDRHGLPLGPVLDQLTAEVRATRRRLDQADARKLPVRLSFPLVVCTLPSFVLLAIAPAVIAALSSLGGTTW